MSSATTESSTTTDDRTDDAPPSLWDWGLKVAASVGVAGMICCVAPAVLFALGLMGGIYAISFADLFYAPDGSAGLGAWILRGVATLGTGFYLTFEELTSWYFNEYIVPAQQAEYESMSGS